MHRSLAAAAIAASLLAACDESERETCPGEPIAALRFDGARALLGDTFLEGRDPEPAVADCADGAGPASDDGETDVGHPERLLFDATLAAAGASTAALCEADDGAVLLGNRTATGFFVEATTSGAVLCSSTCSARMRLVVTGNVSDGVAAPASFEGLVVEVLTQVAGECEACLPVVPGTNPPVRACAARYKVLRVRAP